MTDETPEEMNEEELARYFEDNKDNPALLPTRMRKIRVRRGGASTTFSLRLTPEELEDIQRAAVQADTSVGDFIRRSALDAAKPSPEATAVDALAEEFAVLARRLDEWDSFIALLRNDFLHAASAIQPGVLDEKGRPLRSRSRRSWAKQRAPSHEKP